MTGLEQLLPFVLLALIFWFLLIRPQRKRQMELVRTQRAIEVGDEVLLGAGITGFVAETGDEFLQLEISPGVQMKIARGAVVKVLSEDLSDESAADVSDDVDDTSSDASEDLGEPGTGEKHG